ncbi:amino acid ABC transporter permease [Agrobacterium salinitolerans]|uniref:Amino acid ABC transporter permease n=1 Tax=Agrobacterium salinitolerans TaxID=1183413 RepID=A0A9X3KTB4_9HYPH|nr:MULTISPECIES: amino acid ABC transporter permease [Agrobacterium]MCZ7854956.1 amino acid ABC transporter permease [Agrobacterium salinitolerans]MCZ7893873.1 amino acid ABC transporter permease [Agrobacterium salinitolerans]MCZ7940623.1 amino acid ABC transporter permease [Agrobacterium salinitolerans]TRA84264.1 amino acid ABC transporter permease [Agrobacterium salinitolerans]
MQYQWDFGFLIQYQSLIWTGVLYTIGFTIGTAVSGLIVGCLVALARLSNVKILGGLITGFIEIFRCTPVLVQLVWCYYALPILTGIELSPGAAAFITLTLYGASFFGEIIRGGIISVDLGQWDAGRALGMRRHQLMARVVLPQAFRRMIPPLMNQTVLQLKNTSLLSVLAVPDLLYQGQLITSASYRPLETYTMIAVIYFILLFPLTRFAHRLEARAGR